MSLTPYQATKKFRSVQTDIISRRSYRYDSEIKILL